MFSKRCAPEGEVSAFAARFEQVARLPGFLDLTVSNPTRAGFNYDVSGLRSALAAADWTTYTPESLGSLAARTAVAEHFVGSGCLRQGPDPFASRIALSASTSEAYSYLFKTLCDPGDAVLVPAPSYPLFAELARYDSVQLLPYPLGYDGAWYIDMDAVRRSMTANVRAIVVVSPNNPTGNCLKQTELQGLLQLGVPLICDEVFASYVQPGVSGCSGWAAQSEGLVFTLDGLSKWAGLPQCKLAWTVVSGEARQVERAMRQLEFVADAYLSANGPVQAALPTLLALSRQTQQQIAARVRSNLDTLDELLQGSACTRLHSEGGWTALLQLPNTHDEEAWVTRLLDVGVGVQPGWFYDMDRGCNVVLSLLTPCQVLRAGVSRIDTLVSN